MSIQTTIPFNVRKKNFYGSEDNTSKLDFSNASLRNTPTTKYTPTVKKIVDISSESESNSDTENVVNKNNITKTPKRSRRKNNAKVAEENDSTPPKQKKTVSPSTPCTLLNHLSIISPNSKEDKLIPKQLFSSNKYSEARKALHSSLPENLIGREAELVELENFIQKHLDNGSSASLYVSGPPGTGKTACLSKIMLKPKFKGLFKIVYINCTTMKSAPAIYSKIIEELGLKTVKNKNTKAVIEKYLVQSHKMLLLVLDEMDQLESKNQSVLYSIFEWSSLPKSKLILVGIANALDLTDRILPRLQARCELKPTLLHFKPYSKQQIMDIITERLKEANVIDVFTGTAMQLLAGKVAAVSGDIRRALDIGRRVIEIAESQKMMQILQPSNNNDANTDNLLIQENVNEKPVDFKEVRTVLNGVYGGSQNADTEESNFPMQQKILLCSLMLILNKGKNKDVNIGRLYQVYKKVCEKRRIHAVDMSEFVSLCTLIETRGIVKLFIKKEPRLSKVSLQWDQEVLSAALQDKILTSEIINDVSCL